MYLILLTLFGVSLVAIIGQIVATIVPENLTVRSGLSIKVRRKLILKAQAKLQMSLISIAIITVAKQVVAFG